MTLKQYINARFESVEKELAMLREVSQEYNLLRLDAERWRLLERMAKVDGDLPYEGWTIKVAAIVGDHIYCNLAQATGALLQQELDRMRMF